MKKHTKHIISKSTFIRGTQCHKSLYLNKFHKDLKDDMSENQRSIFARGTNVGELAKQLFPGGKDLTPDQFYNFIPSILKTQELIEKGEKVIYEAAFQYDGVLVLMDILVNDGGKWRAYEVKSAASVKGVYIQDASLQYFVISQSGLKLEDISIVHLNNKYVRNGKLEVVKLFHKKSILEEVLANQDKIKEQLYEQKLILAGKRIPKVEIGAHCNSPYPCDFKGFCWKEVPENSVFSLNRGSKKAWDLFDSGITKISNIPDDYSLTSAQKIQIGAEKSGEDYINIVEIKRFLDTLNYPLFFLDFETVMPAIPVFDKTRTYQQLTFQYSLHINRTKNTEPEHKEHLAKGEKKDPRIGLVAQLVDDLEGEGSILVYNKAFEDRCLKDLARDFPPFAEPIKKIRTRLIDLATPFEKKYYYKAEMKGRYSIKNVLPALVPELSYNDLEIKEGATASFTFLAMLLGTFDGDEAETRKNLIEYCKLDTYAMVRILEKLYEVEI